MMAATQESARAFGERAPRPGVRMAFALVPAR